MKTLWDKAGIVLFWLAWPLVWLGIRRTTRTRVIVRSGNKVLLLRGWFGTGHWMLPGGGLHKTEVPEQGAARELKEETGISLSSAQLKQVAAGRNEEYGLPYKYVAYLAQLPRPADLRRQNFEISDLAWHPLDDLPRLSPMTAKLLKRID